MSNKSLVLRKITATFLICLITSCVFSQQKSTYSLLWKISGKGMANPSFIFGTMHVPDKRVFNFSDSVMLAIQSCPRFALEVQPDSAISGVYKLLQNADSLRSLDKILNSEEYKELAKKFKEKNGYAMGKTDPILLESLMDRDDKPDDKQSFIDAYLYGIARTLNKRIFGLENASPQIDEYFGSPDAVRQRLLGIIDDDAATYKRRSKEEMIKIYGTGDIDLIYKYTQGTDMIDSSILRRNKVMAASIVLNMNVEPIFSAVGAAHLPGPGGVIALLQQAGYTVTPVKASFTGVAATFHIDYSKMNWPVTTDESKGYSISFPGKPVSFMMSGLQNIMYPDIANGLYFGFYVVHKGTPAQPATAKDAFDSTIELLISAEHNTVISKKEFLYHDIPCEEITLKNNNRYMRMRMILRNNLLYHFYVGSIQNHLNQPVVDRFFNSFSCSALPQKTSGPWVKYTDETGAFSVSFPSQPKIQRQSIPWGNGADSTNYTMNAFAVNDSVNSRSYQAEYYDYPTGKYVPQKEDVFLSYVKHFQNEGKLVGDPTKISNNGYEGQEIKLLMDGYFNTRVRIFVRGNRVYMLMKENLQAGLEDVGTSDNFFDSIQLLPFTEPVYYTYQPDSGNYKITLPAKPLLKPIADKDYSNYLHSEVQCLVTNPNSGALYHFQCLKISPYYQRANTDSLYSDLVKAHNRYSDSLIKLDTITLNGMKGREILLMDKVSKTKRRTRIFIDGENYFYLTARTDESELYNNVSNTFFNSLTLTSPSKTIDLTSAKAEKIAHDLASPDTLVSKRALGAISYYDFKPKELHYLYKALERSYPDDTSEYSTRVILIEKLRDIGNDSTLSFLANLYSGLKDKDELKATILKVIPFLNKKTGYDIYLKLLTTDPPVKTSKVYKVFIPLRDSTEFAGKHFEQLLPFIKYDNYRSAILSLAVNIAEDKNNSYSQTLGNNYLTLTSHAQADLENYLKLKDSVDNDYSAKVNNYFMLMKYFKFKEFNGRLTLKYLEKDPKGPYTSQAVIARIYNSLPNTPAVLKYLLDSLDTRYDLMEAYYDQKQSNKIPELYRQPAQFAKLCLYKYVNADDDNEYQINTASLKLLGAVNKGGNIYYVIKFFLAGDEDNKELIGIAGPYKTGSSKLPFDKYYAYTSYDNLKTNWREQAESLIKPLLDTYK